MDGGGSYLQQLEILFFLNAASLQIVWIPSCAWSTPTPAGLLVTCSIAATDDMLTRTTTGFNLFLNFCLLSANPEDAAFVATRMRSLLAKWVSVCPQQTLLPEPWLTVGGLTYPLAGVALASVAAGIVVADLPIAEPAQ